MANPQALPGFQFYNNLRNDLSSYHSNDEGVVAKVKNAGAFFGCRAVAVISVATNALSGAVSAVATAILFPFSYIERCACYYDKAKSFVAGSFGETKKSLAVLDIGQNVKQIWNSLFTKKQVAKADN